MLVRGSCPTVGEPFGEVDGLLVRLRIPGGIVSGESASILAMLATRHAASIEVTNRGNLQFRGVDGAGELADALLDAGLADRDPRRESRRNVVTSPTAGFDPDEIVDTRPLVTAALEGLGEAGPTLPPMFGVTICGGGRIHCAGIGRHLRLTAMPNGRLEVELGGDAMAPIEATPEAVRSAVGAVVSGRHRTVGRAVERRAPITMAPVGLIADGAVGAKPFLGRMTAATFGEVVATATTATGELRTTPWRSFVIPGVADRQRALGELARTGLAVGADDPGLAIDSCIGTQGCRHAERDVQGEAEELRAERARTGAAAPTGEEAGAVHLEGCPKGCGRRR